MTAPAGDLLQARVRALVALYQEIAATRMRGLPLLNPALQVQAVGFELVAATAAGPTGALQPSGAQTVAVPEQATAVGVLITPWFMNLVWLPLQRVDAAAHVGRKVTRHVGPECFEFIAAHENGFGGYEACSLFSPVFEFQSQQAAVETARAVLATLRQPASATVPAPATKTAPVAVPVPPARDKIPVSSAEPGAKSDISPAAAPAQIAEIPQAPARRAFLFGRSAAAHQAARSAVQPHEISNRG